MNISSTIEEIVGEGVEPPTKFSKREGLRWPQILEGDDFFQGGSNCHIKNKLKSEIFNDENSFYISENIFLS